MWSGHLLSFNVRKRFRSSDPPCAAHVRVGGSCWFFVFQPPLISEDDGEPGAGKLSNAATCCCRFDHPVGMEHRLIGPYRAMFSQRPLLCRGANLSLHLRRSRARLRHEAKHGSPIRSGGQAAVSSIWRGQGPGKGTDWVGVAERSGGRAYKHQRTPTGQLSRLCFLFLSFFCCCCASLGGAESGVALRQVRDGLMPCPEPQSGPPSFSISVRTHCLPWRANREP